MGPQGRLKHKTRFWGVGYSYVPLSGKKDVSPAVNRQVQQAGGDGVVELHVTTRGCGWNYIPLLPILPIWPGCAVTTLSGKIVELHGEPTGAGGPRPDLPPAPTGPISPAEIRVYPEEHEVGPLLQKQCRPVGPTETLKNPRSAETKAAALGANVVQVLTSAYKTRVSDYSSSTSVKSIDVRYWYCTKENIEFIDSTLEP